jgi:hypothetical protein
MSDVDSLASIEEVKVFKPFTRESLALIHQRMADEEVLKEIYGENICNNLKNPFIFAHIYRFEKRSWKENERMGK